MKRFLLLSVFFLLFSLSLYSFSFVFDEMSVGIKNDEISFDCLPAKDIVQCLEHWYNVEFSLRNESDFNDIKLSFSVKYEPLEEILEAIGLISGIRYSIIDADHVQLYLD